MQVWGHLERVQQEQCVVHDLREMDITSVMACRMRCNS